MIHHANLRAPLPHCTVACVVDGHSRIPCTGPIHGRDNEIDVGVVFVGV
jgi:hypothetical protein